MVVVTILFFAHARELVDKSEDEFEVDEVIEYKALHDAILKKYDVLKRLNNSFIIAKNEEYLDNRASIRMRDGDEVAIIPPVSGG